MTWLTILTRPARSRCTHKGERQRTARIRARPFLEALEDRTLFNATPVLLAQSSLHLGEIASTAVSPDEHKVYLGRRWSNDHAETNLVVVTLDASGKPVGDPNLRR
jgi:hypothetical protein